MEVDNNSVEWDENLETVRNNLKSVLISLSNVSDIINKLNVDQLHSIQGILDTINIKSGKLNYSIDRQIYESNTDYNHCESMYNSIIDYLHKFGCQSCSIYRKGEFGYHKNQAMYYFSYGEKYTIYHDLTTGDYIHKCNKYKTYDELIEAINDTKGNDGSF